MSQISAIGGIIAIIIAVGGIGYQAIRASYASARYEDAERRISGLRTDLDLADDREQRLEKELIAIRVRLEALENENRTLRSLVPTQDRLRELEEIQNRHYQETTGFIREWRDTIPWFREQVSAALTALRAIASRET